MPKNDLQNFDLSEKLLYGGKNCYFSIIYNSID